MDVAHIGMLLTLLLVKSLFECQVKSVIVIDLLSLADSTECQVIVIDPLLAESCWVH